MYKLNCLNYIYNNQYYFQIDFNKSIKISDCNLIETLKNKECFSENFLFNIFNKFNYSEENIKFLKEKNIIISKNEYRKTMINILEKLIYSIEYGKEDEYINSIFVYSSAYGYRSMNMVKSAIELGRNFIIERSSQNDMKIKFANGYVYDINTKYNIFGENVVGCNITKSKSLTSYLLTTHNIKTPRQKLFYMEDLSGLNSFLKEIKYPICSKPDNMCESKDVFPYIKNQNELEKIINYYRSLYKEFIVEETIIGNTYRLYYCYGEIIGAIQKGMRFVIGDGINSIENLVNKRYKFTKLKGYTEECSLILERLNLNRNKILPLGEKLYISDTATDSDFYDFDIKKLDPYYNKLALNVSKAIGLNTFAIDLISESLTKVEQHIPAIIEIQEEPEFGRGNLNVNNYYMKLVEKLSS